MMPFSKLVSFFCEALLTIFPKIVLFPVFIAIAVAVPLMILVPSQRQLDRFTNSVFSSKTPTCFMTGKDSPVRLASFTNNSFEVTNKQSAGIISPALNESKSPSTTWLLFISDNLLSLKTELVKAIIDKSFSTTRLAFRS